MRCLWHEIRVDERTTVKASILASFDFIMTLFTPPAKAPVMIAAARERLVDCSTSLTFRRNVRKQHFSLGKWAVYSGPRAASRLLQVVGIRPITGGSRLSSVVALSVEA